MDDIRRIRDFYEQSYTPDRKREPSPNPSLMATVLSTSISAPNYFKYQGTRAKGVETEGGAGGFDIPAGPVNLAALLRGSVAAGDIVRVTWVDNRWVCQKSSRPSTPPPCGQICFKVIGCSGTPLSGATVSLTGPGTITGSPCTTGADGTCCITISTAGTYTGFASAGGYVGNVIPNIHATCTTNNITTTLSPAPPGVCGNTSCCGAPFDTSSTLTFSDGANSGTLSYYSSGGNWNAPYCLGSTTPYGAPFSPGLSGPSAADGWWGTFTAFPSRFEFYKYSVQPVTLFPMWYVLSLAQYNLAVGGQCGSVIKAHSLATTCLVFYSTGTCTASLWIPVCNSGQLAFMRIDEGNPNLLCSDESIGFSNGGGTYVKVAEWGGSCNPINAVGSLSATLTLNPGPNDPIASLPSTYVQPLMWLLYPNGSVTFHVTP